MTDPILAEVGRMMRKEAAGIEHWCRQLSDDPEDFERRHWPDCEEIVHLPTGLALRKREPITVEQHDDGRLTMRVMWEPCVARPVQDGEGERVMGETGKREKTPVRLLRLAMDLLQRAADGEDTGRRSVWAHEFERIQREHREWEWDRTAPDPFSGGDEGSD